MSTKLTNIGLAQAICARLCHDLAGAVGAVSNGMNLMNNGSEKIQIQAKEMIEQESQKLVETLRMYRDSYGITNADSDMSLVAIRQQLKAFLPQDVKFNFAFDEGILMLESSLAKLVLCLSMVVIDNIVVSGIFSMNIMHAKNGKDYHIVISATAEFLNIHDDNLAILQGNLKCNTINVQNCRELYLYNLCQEQGYDIKIQKNDKKIEYFLTKSK